MNVSLNGLWINTNNYIRTKITEGLTPLEKKVALIAAAFFALVTVCFLFYRFCKYPPQIEITDPKEKSKTEHVKEQNENEQVDTSPDPSEIDEKGSLDATEIEEGKVVPSSISIAIDNADQLRSLINRYPAEVQGPSGQLRTLYFDAEGRLQGIKGPDANQIWLNDKAKSHQAYQIKIRFQKSESIKNAPFLFEDDLGICPENIQETVDTTLNELNRLANGAFHIAKSDKNLSARPDAPKWLTVLENVTGYPSSSLLGKFQKIEDDEFSPAQQLPIDAIPVPIDVIPESEAEEDMPELKDDTPELNNQKSKLDPSWINDNPTTPLSDLGLTDYDKLKDFIAEHGAELKCLNLYEQMIDNDQFEQLIKSCQNLTHLFINSPIIKDNALEHLKGMPLTIVNFSGCRKLNDKALEHLKGMPLTSVNFSGCRKLNDKALEHLKGMPLTSVNFGGCWNLTDNALEHLKGMPLTSVDFSWCTNLSDKALEHLKGMPLTSVDFSRCDNLTDKALEHLKGMPLTSVDFSWCWNLTDKALEHLKGMPLTSVSFWGCKNLTDKALEHLKGMPLTSVNFSGCWNLTDKALEHLKGMPLTSVDFSWCKNLPTRPSSILKVCR